MEQPGNMQAVIDAARKGFDLVTLAESGHYRIIYTPTHGVQTVDLEKYAKKPHRRRGAVTVFDSPGLNAIMAANADAGAITVYVNPDPAAPAIIAVMNGNGLSGPGFGDFRASIAFRVTPQWTKWKAIDGKLIPQADFVEFIEDNLPDIVDPDSATVMEIVSYLTATRTSNFKSGIRLSSGATQFQNEEDIQAQVGAAAQAVPDVFTLAVAPFFGVRPFKVAARFRFRMQDRKLLLGLKLQRVEDVIATCVADFETSIVLPEGAQMVYGIAP